ncbi:hypothetical protein B0H13DRAFT_1855099 [Mycena leptocephala]|nr:hypothetical protein B0H13DRAFT_1855099 [Mycena leptocephala]
MPTATTHPKLPLELEREIFEYVAVLYPGDIPTLLRVARHVKEWTEPFIYNVGLPYRLCRSTINVWLPEIEGPGFASERRAPSVSGVYRPPGYHAEVPEDLRSLVEDGRYSEDSLPMLLAMPLRRLAVDLHRLFFDIPSICILQSPFLSITHLTLFDDVTAWDPCDHLASLPKLTHLCLWNLVPATLVQKVLERCLRLGLLLNARDDFRTFEPEDYMSVKDHRFVVIVIEDWEYEWALAAETRGNDIWSHGADFVPSKIVGNTSASRFWVDDPAEFSGEEESDVDRAG